VELEVEGLGGGGGGESARREGVDELLAEAVDEVDGGDVEDLGLAKDLLGLVGFGTGRDIYLLSRMTPRWILRSGL
jgi:hypothetical protein